MHIEYSTYPPATMWAPCCYIKSSYNNMDSLDNSHMEESVFQKDQSYGQFSTEDKKSFFFQRGFYCTQFTKEIKTFYHRAAAAKVSLLFCNTKDYVAQRKLS